ncbi:hypothetical protein GCM10027456_09760 [Kineosporia babensis]
MAGLAAVLLVPTSAQASSTPTPTLTAMPAEQLSAQEVPVLGSTTLYDEMDGTKPTATVLVHGVRRIAGATVVYYSAGLAEGADPQALYKFNSSSLDRNITAGGAGAVRLVDFSGEKIYTPLFADNDTSSGRLLASPARSWPAHEPGGVFWTFYAVMPELPAELSTVDVMVGHGDVVQNVPIGTGLLQPSVPQEEPIRMGEAWPQVNPIDQAEAAYSLRPQDSIRPLTLSVANADGTVVEETTEETVTVDISSDVLFAVDSAELDGAASEVLQQVADKLNESADGGEILIVGHTDSTGSKQHNLKLSRERARAVGEALTPLVKVPGTWLKMTGRGAEEPVANNSTEAGRKQNRRVSVIFKQEGAK